MKHENYVTHVDNKEDLVYLKSKHFPVNMRLFNTSQQYKNIILQQCNYIRFLCLTKMDGYKKPHGMSSANARLAFNIIGVTKNRNQDNEYCQIMINPTIINYKDDNTISSSNCGSLTLEEPIDVKRNLVVEVSWYDEDGKYHLEDIGRYEAGLSIQHEIDHNNGILITDREIK